MKKPPTATTEAKSRLQELGEREIKKFIGQIADQRSVGQFLPTVSGFRKMSKVGIERRTQELARRLASRATSKGAGPDREYRSFFAIWRLWVWEKLGEPKLIDAAIDALEEACGAPDGAEKEGAISQAVIALFSSLSKNSVDGKCSREEIERAFQFSPFSETADLRNAVAAARTAAEIERATEYEGLSRRLRKDEDELSSNKSRLDNIAITVERLGSAVDGWSASRAGLLNAIEDTKASLGGRLNQLEARGKDDVMRQTHEAEGGTGAAFLSLEARIEGLTKLVSALSSMASTVDKDNYARAISRIDALEKTSIIGSHALEQLSSQLKILEERLDVEIKAPRAGTIDPAILARLDEIEEALTRNPEPVEPLYETKGLSQSNRAQDPSSIRVDVITQFGKPGSTPVSSFGEVTGPLASMFQKMGLKRLAAKLLAEEVCAALVVGQVVFFKGAYATETSRICARVLCGGSAYRTALPIGLQSGDNLRCALGSEVRVDDKLVAGVSIEGVNLVAFELIKDVLGDLAKYGPHNGIGQTMVFGSLARGVASLPIDPHYLELGPIIDLDCLEWRARTTAEAESTFLALPVAVAQSLRASLNEKTADVEEPQRLVRSFASRRNPRVEHIVLSAYTALVAVRKDKDMPTPLQSLVYGWLVPYWAARRVARQEVDSEVDGGKCDATTPDPRIKLLLDDFEATPSMARSA